MAGSAVLRPCDRGGAGLCGPLQAGIQKCRKQVRDAPIQISRSQNHRSSNIGYKTSSLISVSGAE